MPHDILEPWFEEKSENPGSHNQEELTVLKWAA